MVSPGPISGNVDYLRIILFGTNRALSETKRNFVVNALVNFTLTVLVGLSRVIRGVTTPCLVLVRLVPVLNVTPVVLTVARSVNSDQVVVTTVLAFCPITAGALTNLGSMRGRGCRLVCSCTTGGSAMCFGVLVPSYVPCFFANLGVTTPVTVATSVLISALRNSNKLNYVLSRSLGRTVSVCIF